MTAEIRVAATDARMGLVLRRWRDTDLEAVVTAYSDPDQRRFTQFNVDGTAGGLQWLGVQDRGWTEGDRMSFAVCEDDGSDRPLGHVVLKRPDPSDDSAEVGYWTSAAARGRGIAPRALTALADWAFATFGENGLRRLVLRHAADNEASCRVAEKTGFAFHSVLPASGEHGSDDHLHVREGARA
ncbi:GNAT family N-acetyltransferase [Phytomonospora endophytica]|uniref:RimJ/RimL family protein N-acetyltransferase n=1 Tax=Phytomonospora endophytica TaxID=714109 RepID=A0A841FYD9_9ACTN|nr:GNAT family N-acetyltransferase [Phytomonospora endophytica]MBB6038738.1 RimJ/RimL family protein N-acetyltransferase [Phytomonospora endophytica]GIG68466.1 acetyltransferase [Phytomonospora endophytica]